MELPECPVCLQNYDGDAVIPRVLGCGHTACQSCLSKLPERFPLTVRCPACTQLVKFPSQGPSFLPKNVDLLSLCPNLATSPSNSLSPAGGGNDRRRLDFLPRSWSQEFYSTWSAWVLPSAAVSVDERGGFSAEGREVTLVRVARLPVLSPVSSSVEFSYVVRVITCLSGMREKERVELGSILRACSGTPRKMSSVFGLWGDSDDDGSLHLVCERMGENCGLGKIGTLNDELFAFVIIGVEIINAVIGLHSQGLMAGFYGMSCFGFDKFGHVRVDMGDLLLTGRKVFESIDESGSVSNLWKDCVFVSPETLKELSDRGESKARSMVGYSSDTWSVGCLLLRLLVGEEFEEEFPNLVDERGYLNWVERVGSLVDNLVEKNSDYAPVKNMILKCLHHGPETRPVLSELRASLRELMIKPRFDLARLVNVNKDKSHCIIMGELCCLKGKESGSSEIKVERVEKDFVNGLSEGIVKFKVLEGHRDCISGITIGGGFIFASSFDKTIRVWSFQDFTHVHTFEGHEHKVMALVYVDQEQPLCISGDSGGGLFVWGITTPFSQEPLKKWYEQKDWRYSGIHALCCSKNGFVYTGSGDKSIKAWTLEDGLLACTMNGHKSVVSTLMMCDEVLYSGSWDGTIRLWSLHDHTPLTVLGEDALGTVAAVLSLAVDSHMLIAAYENGSIKVWKNDVFMKSMQLHQGSIFASEMEEKWLFTGGWDNTVYIQEISGDEFHVDLRPIGTVSCGSAVTVLLFVKENSLLVVLTNLLRCITMMNECAVILTLLSLVPTSMNRWKWMVMETLTIFIETKEIQRRGPLSKDRSRCFINLA